MTDDAAFRLWSYLAAHPLAAIAATLAAYLVGDAIWTASGRRPLLNPVLIAIVILSTALTLTGIPYTRYFEGAQFIHVMLGPATVALALPLWNAARQIRRAAIPVFGALLIGSATAMLSAVGLAWLFGATDQMMATIAPKSATTPVAMAISGQLGGQPGLTAVLVILTGVTGATLGTPFLNALRLKDFRARGFAMGLASHGIGAARALTVSQTAGAFASLAMALNALATAALAPLLWRLIFG